MARRVGLGAGARPRTCCRLLEQCDRLQDRTGSRAAALARCPLQPAACLCEGRAGPGNRERMSMCNGCRRKVGCLPLQMQRCAASLGAPPAAWTDTCQCSTMAHQAPLPIAEAERWQPLQATCMLGLTGCTSDGACMYCSNTSCLIHLVLWVSFPISLPCLHPCVSLRQAEPLLTCALHGVQRRSWGRLPPPMLRRRGRERCALLRSCRHLYCNVRAPLTRASPGCRAAGRKGAGRSRVNAQ